MNVRNSNSEVAPVQTVMPSVDYFSFYNASTKIQAKNGGEFVDVDMNIPFKEAIVNDLTLNWLKYKTEYSGKGTKFGRKANLGGKLVADFNVLNGNVRFYVYETFVNDRYDAMLAEMMQEANAEAF